MLTDQSVKRRANMASAAARAARRPGDSEALTAAQNARRDYFALALEDHIKRTVDAAPPLTAAQRNKLCLLLGGGDAA